MILLTAATLLAHMGAWALVPEDGVGLHLVPDHLPTACHEGPERRPGFVPLAESFCAVASSGRTVYALLGSGAIVEIDARDPARPVVVRSIPHAGEAHALAANGRTLYLLGEAGLEILTLDAGRVAERVVHPDVHGDSVECAGRVLRVTDDDRVVLLRDERAGALTFEVSVNDDYYTPRDITVALGDTVRWTNVTGNLHNVFSCTPGQLGCGGAQSNESFSSGAATGFFFLDHTFVAAGSNPYVCQPHTFMVGSVTVTGAAGAPPGVPDGRSGAPMRVAKLAPDGSALSISWDTTSCTGAADHEIVYGYAFGLPGPTGGAFEFAGSRCAIGTASPYAWSGAPTAFAGSAGWVFWLVVATDGVVTEGSLGKDGVGIERVGPGSGGSSDQCGMAAKALTNSCGQ